MSETLLDDALQIDAPPATASCAGGASICNASSRSVSDIDFHERYVGTILKQLGFSHMSARPRHPGQNVEIIEAFKTYGPPRLQVIISRSPNSVCFNVSGLG